MRNYLPYRKSQSGANSRGKLSRVGDAAKRHWSVLLAAIIVLGASGFLFVRFALAAPECKTQVFGQNPLTDGNVPGAQVGQWENTDKNLAYRIYQFYTDGSRATNADGTCASHITVDPKNDAAYAYGGQKAVDVRLGVPNQGSFNNNGIWAGPTGIGSTSDYRPPQYRSNFRSQAAYADDAGLLSLRSTRFPGTNYTLWCQTFGAPIPAGTSAVCPPDITKNKNGDGTNAVNNGAGYMFVADNCHLGDTANGLPSTDSDGFPVACSYGPGLGALQNYTWYLRFMNPANAPGLVAGGYSLRNLIGCGGGNCDGTSQTLNSFNLNQYARNHFYNDPDHEAFRMSASTYLTFAYPIPAQVTINKQPNDVLCPQNKLMNSLNCTGRYAGNSYIISLQKTKEAGFNHAGKLANLTITDTLPDSLVTYSGAGSCGQPVNPSLSGNKLTWVLNTSSQLADLNAGKVVQLCYNVTTKTGNASLQPYTNSVTGSGRLTTGIPADVGSDTATNYIYAPDLPFLSTSGGDVHATGGIDPGFGINCGSGAANITGQSETDVSKGDYVVSAGGTISSFGSNGSPSGAMGSSLQAPHYYGICRPDLVKAANDFILKNPGLKTDVVGPNLAVPLSDTSGNGRIYRTSGDITINSSVTVSGRVTLYVRGDLIIKGDIAVSSNPEEIPKLGSFGVIVTGNIYIDRNVTSLAGYYYAQGPTAKIVTCASGKTAYLTSDIPALLANCRGNLTLTGLMSANQFNFNRTGNPTNIIVDPDHPNESLNYSGLLFVAPPPAFDGKINVRGASSSVTIEPPQY